MSEFFCDNPVVLQISDDKSGLIEIEESKLETKEQLTNENLKVSEESKLETKEQLTNENLKVSEESKLETKEQLEHHNIEKTIIKINLTSEQILLGLLTICGVFIIFIKVDPTLLIGFLMSIMVIVFGGLFVINKDLSTKILETGFISIPLLFSMNQFILI